MNVTIRIGVVASIMLLAAPAAPAQIIMEWVTVGDAGNADDVHGAGYGGVAYVYDIGKYEVTNGQYRAFLNAVAKTDTYSLYYASMAFQFGGISQSGSPGSYVYSEKAAGWDEKPVNFVDFYDVLRFANWLHNGQPTGAQDSSTTEDGAYTFSGATTVGGRNPGALVFLPSEDEWYKAAYYKGGGTNAGYWDYAAQSDTVPVAEPPPGGINSANYDNAVGGPYYSTDVGAYTASTSANGTHDQTANLWEWNEGFVAAERCIRGGDWFGDQSTLPASHRRPWDPADENSNVGFRVARAAEEDPAVPAASAWTLAVTLAILLALAPLVLHRANGQRRRRERPSHVGPTFQSVMPPVSKPIDGLESSSRRLCRVEMWRGGHVDSVSTSRSSNRTCGFPASGSRTRYHAVALGKLCVSSTNRTNPNCSLR